MPTRQFSVTILAGSWPATGPLSCDTLARTQRLKAQELLTCAEEVRAAADRVAANQSGATTKAFHTTSYQLASTFTSQADRYFAMGRASSECAGILSGLRQDLDRIDRQAHERIEQIMKSAKSGPARIAARVQAIGVIVQARGDAIAKSTEAAGKIADEGTHSGIESVEKPSGAQALDFKQGGGQGDPPPPDPKILNVTPSTDPQGPDALPPGQTSLTDLNDTTPGWPHTVTGDPKGPPGHPMIDGKLLPITAPDGTRLLPTGVGRDPNGNVIVAFSNPPYVKGTDPSAFTTKDTQLWNFADPQHPVKIGTLPNMSQASVYYNSAEKQWVVVGNDMSPDGIKNGTPRTVWTAPETPGNSSWMQNLGHGGTIPGGGTRENQYIPLKGGGVMLLDAADNQGVHAYVAPNTQGLTSPDVATRDIATPNTFHPAIPPAMPPGAPAGSTWQPNPVPYGATVINDVINADGTESVTVRVSTWDQVVAPTGVPLPPDMAGDQNYFPHTYTYNVTIGR